MDEKEFIKQYSGYHAQTIARHLYRALNPTGMRTNGPMRVCVDASHLARILQKWKVEK